MARYAFIVLSNALEGREEEYNDWYDSRHLQDVLAVPGFISGRRFEAAAESIGAGAAKWKYLAIYEIETDDLQATLSELIARGHTPLMPISAALDLGSVQAVAYRPRE